jgi:organic hydroperoxide reductase OsmC/OhrA
MSEIPNDLVRGLLMSGHHYTVSVTWVGNRGTGTSGYKDYGREHTISSGSKIDIPGSADKSFFGDTDRWNPEELLIAALAQCHMLSFLHVAADAGVVVTGYTDSAEGTLTLDGSGSGRVTEVVLRPQVEVSGEVSDDLEALHHRASELCFIANSVNFPVRHVPTVVASH